MSAISFASCGRVRHELRHIETRFAALLDPVIAGERVAFLGVGQPPGPCRLLEAAPCHEDWTDRIVCRRPHGMTAP